MLSSLFFLAGYLKTGITYSNMAGGGTMFC
jgi:hypothetical protein